MLQLEIIGNLGNDAEIKEFNGKKYVSMNVAHSEKKRDANGSVLETTTWVSVLWYGDGGNLTQYLKRGVQSVLAWSPYTKGIYRQAESTAMRLEYVCQRSKFVRWKARINKTGCHNRKCSTQPG